MAARQAILQVQASTRDENVESELTFLIVRQSVGTQTLFARALHCTPVDVAAVHRHVVLGALMSQARVIRGEAPRAKVATVAPFLKTDIGEDR